MVNKEELLGLVQDVRKVDMRDPVLDYVTTLVEKTRTHPQAALGVSPRGALAGLPDGEGVCVSPWS